MVDLVINNGTILTMDKERRIIRDGSVAIKDGKILAVGKTRKIKGEHSGKKIIDANGMVVMPGFVNTHIHGNQSFLRGLGEHLHLFDRLNKIIWPLQAGLTKEEAYLSTALSSLEMVKAGVTCCNTMEAGDNVNESIKALADVGIRAEVGKTLTDQAVPKKLIDNPKKAVLENTKLIRKWHGMFDQRIKYRLCPASVLSCSEDLLSKCSELSKKYDIGIHTHANEDWETLQIGTKNNGLPDIEYLHSLDLTGNKVILAHCVIVSNKELKLLVETGTRVSYSPLNPAKSGNGIANIAWMVKSGVVVGLASDTAASNTNLDMFEEMRIAGAIQRGNTLDPKCISTEKLLEMGTIDAAKSLALEDKVGSIEPKKRADIILINVKKPHFTPYQGRLVSHLVWSAYASDVETTIVDGKIIMENRKIKTIDESAIIEKVNGTAEETMKRLGIGEEPVWPWV